MIFTTLSQVTQLLNGSPIWKDYEQQKHDLFLDNEKPLALTQVRTGMKSVVILKYLFQNPFSLRAPLLAT